MNEGSIMTLQGKSVTMTKTKHGTRLVLAIALMCSVAFLLPAVSAITPLSNDTGTYWYTGGGGCSKTNCAIDGSTSTWIDGAHAAWFYFAPNTHITSVRFFVSDNTTRHIGFSPNVSGYGYYYTETSGGAAWQEYSFPNAINVSSSGYNGIAVTCSDSWLFMNELEFTGYNGTYSDGYVATFTGTPTTGIAPLSVGFTASGLVNNNSVSWSFGDGNSTTTSGSTISHVYTGTGTYSVSMTYNKPGGSSNTTTRVNYITTTGAPVSNITMWFVVMDSTSHAQLAGLSTGGIQNTTSGVWRNSTNVPSGLFYVSDTGANHEYPLTNGEYIGVDVSATGYVDSVNTSLLHSYHTIAVDSTRTSSLPYPIYLTKESDVTDNGTWNLNVVLKNAVTGKYICSGVTLTLYTGVNGRCSEGSGCAVTSPASSTDTVCTWGWHNVTASTSASLDITSQAYYHQSQLIPIRYPSNYTETMTYNLVPIGAVLTTATTSGGSSTATATATSTLVQPTDASGNVIIDSTQKGIAAFDLLINALYTIVSITVGLLLIWLMWMVVYMITGGKIIDKIMKRGRR